MGKSKLTDIRSFIADLVRAIMGNKYNPVDAHSKWLDSWKWIGATGRS